MLTTPNIHEILYALAILNLPFQSIGSEYKYSSNDEDCDKMSVTMKCDNDYGGCIMFIKQIKLEYNIDWQWKLRRKISNNDWMSYKPQMTKIIEKLKINETYQYKQEDGKTYDINISGCQCHIF